ncbi:MAG: hypothetical protein QNJ45_21900, partial [Ardenticatenaceae bacterium]|nr:hypothetical protein [Ardenticatenaceae bacterium]
ALANSWATRSAAGISTCLFFLGFSGFISLPLFKIVLRYFIYTIFGTVSFILANTQHPTPNTQHPTPNTQHPSPITHHPSPIT